jgi:hypothetical protein
MRMRVHLEGDRTAGIQTHMELPAGVDLLDRAQFTIRDVVRPVRRGDLDAIAHREHPLSLPIESITPWRWRGSYVTCSPVARSGARL